MTYDVVLIGGGPVGLTLANLLGVHGVRTLLLERNFTTVDEPRAIAIDAEALRTLQSAGLYDAVAGDILLGFSVDYLNGRGNQLFSMQLSQTPYGHAQQNSFDQPTLERQVRAGLERFPHVDVRFGHAAESFEQNADGVVVCGQSPAGPFEVHSRYLVGCDGGRSLVRQKLGIQMQGHTAPQKWLVIDTADAHLAETLECRFFCDPARPAMTLRKLGGKRRWEWMLMKGETEEQLLDDAVIHQLLAPHTRVEQVRVERKCVYTFHSIVADRYRDGRVFIAGDAAHMMPPFAGQGMNSGIRDALNLSWKLALMARGLATSTLLDTYQVERRGHVVEATAVANRLGSLIQPTSRIRAALRDAIFFCLNLSAAGQRAFDRFLLGTLRVPSMKRGAFVRDGNDQESLVGQFAVQPKVRTAGGEARFDDILGPWFAVVGYDVDPATAMPEEARAFWQHLGARFVHVLPKGQSPMGDAVEDHTGALAAWFAGPSHRFVGIRPDKFCAVHFSPSTAVEVTRAFSEILGGGPGRPALQDA